MRSTVSNVIADRIDRALRGDRDALEDLVRFEGPRLFGIAWRITGDTALAEDVVQEVFLRILGGRVQYHRSGSGEAWLSRVTAHAAIDLVRRRTARERREEAYAMGGADRAGEARDAVADAEVRALVAEGFGTLPIDVRAALWLTVVEGDSLRQVSHAIGLPVTTIHRRVHDGLETLKKFIARRGATAVLAVPMADVLRRMPAPPAPGGLAAGVLARIAASSAAGGAVEAGAAAGRLIRKGDLFMAALNAKKAGTGVVIALLLLLGAAAFVADPFHLRGGREVEIAKAPAAAPAPPAAVNAPPTAPAGEPEESGKPEEASPVDPFGSLLAHAVHEDDLTPVPGVLARAFRKGSPELLTVTTDENGEARFPQVPEGSFQVYLQRGSTTSSASSSSHPPRSPATRPG
jgi:RNA polymerase sigma-70 factor (ECF subfamily)